MTRVTWEEKASWHWLNDHTKSYSGIVIGSIRKWFRSYLIVNCDDGIIRCAPVSRVVVKGHAIEVNAVNIKGDFPQFAYLIDRTEKQYQILLDNLKGIERLVRLLPEGKTTTMGILEMLRETESMPTPLEFDLPKKKKVVITKTRRGVKKK